MTTDLLPRTGQDDANDAATAASGRRLPFGILGDLERPGQVFRDLGPNWFASVMGTGIVATAGATLPLTSPFCGRSRRRCGWRMTVWLVISRRSR